jgi:hypothetical protein
MINSQFSASALGSRCDKITKIRSSTISYQQVPKVNNICVGICLYVSCSEVINNVIAFTAAAGTSSQGVVIGLSNSNVGLDRDDSGYKNIAYAIYPS